MALFRMSRLSVQPVTPREWEFILRMEGQAGGEEEGGDEGEGGGD